MPESRLCVPRRQLLFALAISLSLVSSLPAQQPQANIRSIDRYHLKADRAGDFRSVIKEIQAVLRKAGHNRGSSWWQSLNGPNEMARVVFHPNWAELDAQPAAFREAAAELAPLMARMMQCVDHSERIIDVVMPELGLPRSSEIPPMISNLRVLVKPERLDEYVALVKNELLPAVQKSGLKTFLVARTRFGGPATEFRTALGLQSWADLDRPSPIVTALGGEAGYQKFLARIRPLMVESEYMMYRHIAELDFIPAK